MNPIFMDIALAILQRVCFAAFAYLAARHYISADQAKEASEALSSWLLEHLVVYGPIVLSLAWLAAKRFLAPQLAALKEKFSGKNQ